MKFVSTACDADGFKVNVRPSDPICLDLNQSAGKSFDKQPLRVVVRDEAGGMHTVEVPLRINVRPKAAAEKQP